MAQSNIPAGIASAMTAAHSFQEIDGPKREGS